MLKIMNPATERVLAEMNEDTPGSVEACVRSARDAQEGWAATPLVTRIETLGRFRTLLCNAVETLARTLTREVGKPITQARSELQGTLGRLDFFLETAPLVLGKETVLKQEGLREVITREPLGVVGNISAWNFPYFVGSNVLVPALLAGNAVVYKPSEYATMSGLAMANLLWEAGVPRDAFIPLIGGIEVGASLVRQPLDGIFFTGSYATGLRIAQSVGGSFLPLQLDLGGKDPSYVCEDVDVAKAATSLADGAFYNTGQSGCSVERIYAHTTIYEEFVSAFLAEVEAFKLGDPLEEDTYIGPLTRAGRLKVLEDQVADAVARGGLPLCGGRPAQRPGYYFEPTVFRDVNHDMALMRDESFGPIIGIQRVTDDTEAVEMMNDTDYGLTAGVYCKDERRARAILSRVDAGTVYWNCCDRVSPRLPWSGRGHSGIGVTLSKEGITAFTRPKAWHLRG